MIPNYSERFTGGVVKGDDAIRGFGAERFQTGCLDQVGEYAEIRCAARDVDTRGERDGFAGIGNFRLQKILEARFYAIGDLVQNCCALRYRQAAPLAG